MYYDIIFGRLTTVDLEITACCIALLNRAAYNIDHCDPTKGENYKLAKEFGQQLINNTHEVIGHPPIYKDSSYLCLPKLYLSLFSSSHIPDIRKSLRVTLSTLKLSVRTFANWGHMLRKWQVGTLSSGLSISKRSRKMFSKCGLLLRRNQKSARSRRIASRHCTRV